MKKITMAIVLILFVFTSVQVNAVDLNSIQNTIRTNEINSSASEAQTAPSLCSGGNCSTGGVAGNIFSGDNSGGIGGFFQKIIGAIKGIFEKIAGIFKNIFGGMDNGGTDFGGNDNFNPPPVDTNKVDPPVKDDNKTDEKKDNETPKPPVDNSKVQTPVRKVVPLNSSNFSKEVVESKGIVIVDFYATWCGPCKQMAPVMDSLASKTDGSYKVTKVDTDRAKDLSRKFGIRSLPTFMIFKDGKPVKQFSGGKSESGFRQLINSLK